MSLVGDTAAAMEALRRCGTKGGTLTHDELRNLTAVVLGSPAADAVTQSVTDTTAFAVLATTCTGVTATQFDILDAFTILDTAADIVAAIATASAAVRTAAADSNTAGITAALSAAAIADSQPASIPPLDGYDT